MVSVFGFSSAGDSSEALKLWLDSDLEVLLTDVLALAQLSNSFSEVSRPESVAVPLVSGSLLPLVAVLLAKR